MEKDNFAILDMLPFPSFCAQNGKVIKSNAAACALLITRELPIEPLFKTGREEYANFKEGMLSLTLMTEHGEYQATVTRTDGVDFFLLQQPESLPELRAFQLAAVELREPLSRAMLCADKMCALSLTKTDSDYAKSLNRSLYQILRLTANMADAAKGLPVLYMDRMNIVSLIREILDRVECMMNLAAVNFTYDIPDEEVITAVDSRLIERAVLNMLSNAFKFVDKGGHVHASLTRHGNYMVFSVQDDGSGIAEAIRPSLFTRYLRQADIEDTRLGIGLGMSIIRAAARTHGGAVLVDHPEKTGTRVTLTVEITPPDRACIKEPLGYVDYAGEMNHTLIELSDVLPKEIYGRA